MPNNVEDLPNLVVIPKGYAALNAEGMGLANLAAWHLQRIGNSGILAALPEPGSASQLGSAPNPVATFTRPWITEPPGAIPFDEQGALPISAGQLDMPVVQMRVPQGFDGVVNYVSNNVIDAPAFVQFSGDVVWKIIINGKPIRNFGNILAEKGTIAQGRAVSPIRLFSGDLVQYVVSSLIPGSTICSLTGYLYPSKGVS